MNYSGSSRSRSRPSPASRWLRLVIGVTTVLALVILVGAVIKGTQDGRRQQEQQARQQVAMLMQQAEDLQADGRLQASLQSYRQVLALDPDNQQALDGIEELLALAAQPPSGDGPNTEQESPTAVPTTAGPAEPLNPVEVIWADAEAQIADGRWEEAIDRLLQVKAMQPDFRSEEVDRLLFTAYVSHATARSNAGSVEEAVILYDRALELRPDATEVRVARNVIAEYVEALNYWYADWPQAITLLDRIFQTNPGYRDVRQRLQEAHLEYGDSLARDGDWCSAAAHYADAIAVLNGPGLDQKAAEFQTLCTQAGQGAEIPGEDPQAAPSDPIQTPAGSTVQPGTLTGRVLYSSVDPVDNRHRIFAQPVSASVSPVPLVDDAMQPDLRPDGRRIAFRSTRGDMLGLGGFDPGTELRLRFSNFVEDSLPSWNGDGNRLVFASNREGDRRWRIYVTWADGKNEAQMLTFGVDPHWHPGQDRIVYRGCDDRGNRCGLWTMDGAGANQAPLTDNPADAHPRWSPNGQTVVFMTNRRDGNWELYRVDAGGGAVTRLTNHPANDGLPAFSPDGSQLVFLSDRDGAWKLWTMPVTGGRAQLIAPITGQLPNWMEQSLQWVQ